MHLTEIEKERLEQGDRNTQTNVASQHERLGEFSEAFKLYKKAAQQGCKAAQFKTGHCYYRAVGVEKNNYTQAVKWFERSAWQGYADAEYYLGYCYENNLGVDQDDTSAMIWYCKAANQGHRHAKEALEKLLEKYKESQHSHAVLATAPPSNKKKESSTKTVSTSPLTESQKKIQAEISQFQRRIQFLITEKKKYPSSSDDVLRDLDDVCCCGAFCGNACGNGRSGDDLLLGFLCAWICCPIIIPLIISSGLSRADERDRLIQDAQAQIDIRKKIGRLEEYAHISSQDDESIEEDLKNLQQHLIRKRRFTTQSFQFLINCPTIKYLDLRGVIVSEDAAKLYADIIKNNSLKRIIMDGVEDKYISLLFSALKETKTLQELSLETIALTSGRVIQICELLKNHSSLQILHLSGTALDTSYINFLAKALEENKTLKKLYLRQCELNGDCLKLFEKVVAQHPLLEFVSLSYNNIPGNALASFVDAILKNNHAIYIEAWSNPLGSVGIKSLVKTLQKYPLLQLNLSDSNINLEGLKELAQFLEKNRSVHSVNLYENQEVKELKLGGNLKYFNEFGNTALQAAIKSFITTLKNNYTITRLNIDWDSMPEVKEFLTRNYALFNELLMAIVDNNPEKISELISKGVSIHQRANNSSKYAGYSPVMLAARLAYGSGKSLAYILNHITLTDLQEKAGIEALVQHRGKKAMEIAAVEGFQEASQLLARKEAQFKSNKAIVSEEKNEEQKHEEQKFEPHDHDSNEIQFGELIGKGRYGFVYKGTLKSAVVAIKQVQLQGLAPKDIDPILKEAEIMEGLRHPHIVQFYKSLRLQMTFNLVMEFMSNGSLFSVLENARVSKKLLPLSLRLQIALDIISGLEYLHSNNVLHRDLKSLNVLLNSEMRAKLADFGLSKIQEVSSSNASQLFSTAVSSQQVGSLRWMAPELFAGQKYQASTDIHSFGMVLYELASHQLPFSQFKNDNVVHGLIVAGKVEQPVVQDCPLEFTTLIQQCLSPAEKRPQTATLVKSLQALFQKYETSSENSKLASAPMPPQQMLLSGPIYQSNRV